MDPHPISYESNNKTQSVVHKLTLILRECFLTHRWKDAVQIFLYLITHSGNQDRGKVLWKAGLEVLQVSPESDFTLVKDFYKTIRSVSDIQGIEVYQEYMLYLIENGDLDTLQELVKGENWEKRRVENPGRLAYVRALVHGYTGMTWYILWKQERGRLDKLDQQDTTDWSAGDIFLSQTVVTSKSKLNSLAQKAVEHFQKLIHCEGIWDIFVTKHVEILEYDNQHAEAFTVLEEYADKYPDNVNAHKYLYNYHCKHNTDAIMERMETLKTIAQLVPSDPLVLDLCTHLQKESLGAAVPFLFSLLDFACWQTELSPWTMMADLLDFIFKEGKKQDGSADIVQRCWNDRHSWWPAYHFTTYQLDQIKDNSDLVFSKTVVACMLCGHDQEFVSAAVTKMKPVQKKYIKKINPLIIRENNT